jgi:hypothetical protein
MIFVHEFLEEMFLLWPRVIKNWFDQLKDN